jgi:hypothetical protein
MQRGAVPEVIAYNDTLANALGAPSVIMEACSGLKAGDIWYDRLINGNDDVDNASAWQVILISAYNFACTVEDLAQVIAPNNDLYYTHQS